MQYCIIVNENMYDTEAYIMDYDPDGPVDIGLRGWERIWGVYATREEAQIALIEAKDYVNSRSI